MTEQSTNGPMNGGAPEQASGRARSGAVGADGAPPAAGGGDSAGGDRRGADQAA